MLEYLEGQDLRQRLTERHLGEGEIIRVALAISEALAEAHSHRVLHRDLKLLRKRIVGIRINDSNGSRRYYHSCGTTGVSLMDKGANGGDRL